MNRTDVVNTDNSKTDIVDAMQDNLFKARRALGAQMHANEVALKKVYTDWVFKKLNLTKYR